MNKTRTIILILLSTLLSQEFDIDGNLKVSGTIDAQGNPITNVGEPIIASDVATAQFVESMTTGKGQIIILKCPWITTVSFSPGSIPPPIGECDPPLCPDGWTELGLSNEVVGGFLASDKFLAGNYLRYCIEEEE